MEWRGGSGKKAAIEAVIQQKHRQWGSSDRERQKQRRRRYGSNGSSSSSRGMNAIEAE